MCWSSCGRSSSGNNLLPEFTWTFRKPWNWKIKELNKTDLQVEIVDVDKSSSMY